VAFGIWGAITGVAVSLGPILGGAITTGINWRGIFLVNVPVGVAAVAVTLWKVHESRSAHPGRPDWAGFALLTAGLVAFVYGLIRASETSWGDTGVVTCLVLGCVLLSTFVVLEFRIDHPMFDMSLFRTPTFVGGLVAAFAMNGSLFAMFLYLVLYLQDILGYSALDTGLRLLVSTGGTFFAAALSGRLSERVPLRYLIAPGLTLVGVGLLLMSGLNGTSSWTHLLPGFIVAGIGAGLVNPPLASTAIGVVTPERSGMASGVNSTFRQIGFAMSIAALGSIFARALSDDLGRALTSVRGLGAHAPQYVAQIRQGDPGRAIAAAPPALRGQLEAAIRSSFASGIDNLVLITAIVAFVGAACALVLIRSRDFLARSERREVKNQDVLAGSAQSA
jgi:predicted MFS family arabinose efflux permease